MKAIYFTFLLLSSGLSSAQKWTPVGNTGIEYVSFVERGHTTVFFKKDSSAIGMPATMSDDFRQLFLQDKHSFDFIIDSCLHFNAYFISDSLEAMFKNQRINHFVYFIERKIEKEKDKEYWNMGKVNLVGLPFTSNASIIN